MASLLGVSVRAVQSYEQGWRPVPSYVQQMTGLLLFLEWRKGGKRPKPCWKVRACAGEQKSRCAVYQLRAGDLCWLIAKNGCHHGTREGSWKSRMSRCEECAVMKEWLEK
jgi:hypothetical protein